MCVLYSGYKTRRPCAIICVPTPCGLHEVYVCVCVLVWYYYCSHCTWVPKSYFRRSCIWTIYYRVPPSKWRFVFGKPCKQRVSRPYIDPKELINISSSDNSFSGARVRFFRSFVYLFVCLFFIFIISILLFFFSYRFVQPGATKTIRQPVFLDYH